MNPQQNRNFLKNVSSFSLPGINLLEVSLVEDTNPELKDYKKKYFFFLSFVPGEKNQNGPGRTFNRTGRINMKIDADKILGIAHAIRLYSEGKGQIVGDFFSIYADNSKSQFNDNSGSKSLSVSVVAPKSDQQNTKYNNVYKICISMKQGNSAGITAFLEFPNALAFADILEILSKKALEMEFNKKNINNIHVPETHVEDGNEYNAPNFIIQGNPQPNRMPFSNQHVAPQQNFQSQQSKQPQQMNNMFPNVSNQYTPQQPQSQPQPYATQQNFQQPPVEITQPMNNAAMAFGNTLNNMAGGSPNPNGDQPGPFTTNYDVQGPGPFRNS